MKFNNSYANEKNTCRSRCTWAFFSDRTCEEVLGYFWQGGFLVIILIPKKFADTDYKTMNVFENGKKFVTLQLE